MTHLSGETLDALRAGRTIDGASFAHVDRCLVCRKRLGAPLPAAASRSDGGTRRTLLALAGCATAVLAFATITPIRSAASGFVEIFEPHQIAFIPMTTAELGQMSAMPEFSDFGSFSEVLSARQVAATSVTAAQAQAGFRLRLPPSMYSSRTSFDITSPSIHQFVFSESKAREAAARKGIPWEPMPPGMDGSVVRVLLPSMVVAAPAIDAEPFHAAARSQGVVYVGHVRRFGFGAGRGNGNNPPSAFAVMQMQVPKVGSTGVPIQTIEQYLVDRPGVPARLAAAFAALRDPTTALPLPIPLDRQYAHPVFVDGVWGTAIGDDTRAGAGVVWERNGMLYAVGAAGVSLNDTLAVANSLR